MIYPKLIKKGSKVAILAPSGPVKDEGREHALKMMERLGLETVICKSFYERADYLAGDDKLRADDINKMFADTSIEAIFAAKGGYGSQRLLPYLDNEVIKNNPKIFVGYSDITALHILFNKLGFVCYHGIMPAINLHDDKGLGYKSLVGNIFERHVGLIEMPEEFPIKTMVEGSCEGELVGGNMSLIASSVGTINELDFTGKIIFFEEVYEEPYKIDRMINQLKLSGALNKANGYILGQFTDCEPVSPHTQIYMDVLEQYLRPLNKPCIYGVSAGHGLPNITLPMGANVKIGNNEIIVL